MGHPLETRYISPFCNRWLRADMGILLDEEKKITVLSMGRTAIFHDNLETVNIQTNIGK